MALWDRRPDVDRSLRGADLDADRSQRLDHEVAAAGVGLVHPLQRPARAAQGCDAGQLHSLEEAAVIVSPGSMYGPSGEGFFRISLTTPDERIEEAVERMREHLA